MRLRQISALLIALPLLSMSMPAASAGARPGRPYVARAVFTTGIVKREPVDDITTLTTDANHVYYFADVHNLTGQTVIQRWEYRGHIVSQVSFPVGGPRWRIYSLKALNPTQTGEWEASVRDPAGVTLAVNTFDYVRARTKGAGVSSGTPPQVHKQQ
ncbi:MAG: DUF2914 domain-containing protein [Acidiferrobacteraceae bacterium]